MISRLLQGGLNKNVIRCPPNYLSTNRRIVLILNKPDPKIKEKYMKDSDGSYAVHCQLSGFITEKLYFLNHFIMCSTIEYRSII